MFRVRGTIIGDKRGGWIDNLLEGDVCEFCSLVFDLPSTGAHVHEYTGGINARSLDIPSIKGI